MSFYTYLLTYNHTFANPPFHLTNTAYTFLDQHYVALIKSLQIYMDSELICTRYMFSNLIP
jgi:hypothetical protein